MLSYLIGVDGAVDSADITYMLTKYSRWWLYGELDVLADFNRDFQITSQDLTDFLLAYNNYWNHQ
ncbi:MAG: hypothetical protein ACQCN3_03350 [Candidatus Bathyarchaeia archaeon]